MPQTQAIDLKPAFQEPAKPEILRRSHVLSAIPNIVHGFTGITGGCSEGAFSSLNLSLRVGDERAAVLENQRRAMHAVGKKSARLITVKQVHGNGLVQVTQNAGKQIQADGLWTRDRKAAIAILTADCVPILLADQSGTTVCAIHAGWRGTNLKIAKVAIEALVEAGAELNELCAAIGPSIGFEAFEIGAEVAVELRDSLGESSMIEDRPDGKARADLQGLNRALLLEAGLDPSRVEVIRHCTQSQEGYFSYRRDQGKTGRQGAMIALA
ncbi:MAG: peptidoglycan editing factor PgeF [Deltaproteobacteria bacterium]|jgi:polyphenol oxidase|nr:peptidoglycan editing factor PgeF [Deltaproteobacteria bacterium]MBT6435512.1 peptidoglycan editing factor PgeF [Deltaproteobacteria bacterium]MBT6489826.1 peptidoglycan editing factor PgeF [Deltaproteobacteria bacterium]